MIKSFDIKVHSNHSANWYDRFKVDTVRGIVYFHQCDSRRGGQVARYMQITFMQNGTALIEARSANGSRYEQFKRTQCLKLALRLLIEARSEYAQAESVEAISRPVSSANAEAVTVVLLVVLAAIGLLALIGGVINLSNGGDTVTTLNGMGLSLVSFVTASLIARSKGQ